MDAAPDADRLPQRRRTHGPVGKEFKCINMTLLTHRTSPFKLRRPILLPLSLSHWQVEEQITVVMTYDIDRKRHFAIFYFTYITIVGKANANIT